MLLIPWWEYDSIAPKRATDGNARRLLVGMDFSLGRGNKI
ncbi:hypothetical protein SAMN05216332_102158 [Nitrosospira briensis]|nr:hypothetical protein SAMN05216332_102158 [Nitrosospira briensis]